MTRPPAVSVLMPVRNMQTTVLSAVDSILNQQFEELELIVVDDGSTDGTAQQLARRRDPRLRVIRQDNTGIVGALNHGLAAARGPLLARMDGDDLARPDRIGAQVGYLERHLDIGVCDSRVEIFRDDGPVAGGFRAYQQWLDTIEGPDDFVRNSLIENPVVHPASCSRTAIIRDVGGYREGGFPEDYDLWLRCLRNGVRFHKLPDRLLRWRDHGARLTRTDGRYGRAGFFQLKWEHLQHWRLGGEPRVVIWGAGPTARPWLRALSRSSARLVAVFDIDPVKIGRTRQGVEIRPIDDLERADYDLLLIAVGARGARQQIRHRLATTALVEGEQFLFVA